MHQKVTFVDDILQPPFMSKLLIHAALGALVGAGTSIIIDKAQDRAEAGKPALPSALLAAAASLLPLARAVAQQVVETIDGFDLPEADDEAAEPDADALASASGDGFGTASN